MRQANKFDSKKYFVNGTDIYVSPLFWEFLLSEYMRPISHRGIEGVGYIDLSRSTATDDLLLLLGGEEKARSSALTPDQIASLIDLQKKGQKGVLLVDGHDNDFLVIGEGKELCFVTVARHPQLKWYINACKVRAFDGYSGGRRIFYLKS